MNNENAVSPAAISTIERVLIQGDLAPLKPDERVQYYRQVCESVGLNPLTKPFEYITLNGKLQLYARKDCTDQLRKRDGVSIYDLKSAQVGDIYVVTASARNREGREDCATGAVAIKGLSGDNLANALMKAETKSKRRVTLSLCGLGMLDETELETIHESTPAQGHKTSLSALVFPRGKFKGMTPAQVPSEGREANYLDWYAANVLDGDDDLYAAVQAEIRKRAGGEPEAGATVGPVDGPGLPPGVEFNSWRDYMRDDPDRAMVLVQQMRGVSPSLYSDPAAQLSVMRACEAAMAAAGIPYEPIEAAA